MACLFVSFCQGFDGVSDLMWRFVIIIAIFIAKCKRYGFLRLQNNCILFKSLSIFHPQIFGLPELRGYLCGTNQKTIKNTLL